MKPITDSAYLPIPPPLYPVGREHLLKQLLHLLKSRQRVLLYGRAGVGKRSLAAMAAGQFIRHGQAVIWISAAGQAIENTPLMLAQQIVQAYADHEMPSRDVLQKQIPALLLQHRPLAILDSPGALPDVARFIREYQIQNIPVMIIHEVAVDGPWEPLFVRRLDNKSSIQLYTLLTGEHAEKNRHLKIFINYADGHPLVIHLVARQIARQITTLPALVAALPEPSADFSERIDYLIGLAVKALDAAEQGLLMAIGAGFSTCISQVLLSRLLQQPLDEVKNLCKPLVESGLLTAIKIQVHTTYHIHPLIKAFALQELTRSNRMEDTRQRLLVALVALAQDAVRAEQVNDLLVPEMAHMRAAAVYARDNHHMAILQQLVQALQPAESVLCSGGCGFYLEQIRQIYEDALSDTARGVKTGVLDKVPGATDTQKSSALAIVEPPVNPLDDTTPSLTMIAVTLEELQKNFENALEQNNSAEAARLAMAMGYRHSENGQTDDGLKYFREALNHFEVLNDLAEQLRTLETLGIHSRQVQALRGAMGYTQRALDIAAQLHDDGATGRLLILAGNIHTALNDVAGAMEAYRHAIEVLQQITPGNPEQSGIAEARLATMYLDKGLYQEAIRILNQAIDHFEKAGRQDLQGHAQGSLGTALGYLGRWQEAGQKHALALRIARELNDTAEERFQLHNLAYVAEAEGRISWAIKYHRQALYLAMMAQDDPAVADIAFNLGRLLIDDPLQITQAAIVLNVSLQLQAQPHTKQLLDKAHGLLRKLKRRGQPQPPAEPDLLNYAAAAYPHH